MPKPKSKGYPKTLQMGGLSLKAIKWLGSCESIKKLKLYIEEEAMSNKLPIYNFSVRYKTNDAEGWAIDIVQSTSAAEVRRTAENKDKIITVRKLT